MTYGIVGVAFEVAAAEVTVGPHVSDNGFDGGAAAQLALDDAEDPALLAKDEDAMRVLRLMAAVSRCRHGRARSRGRSTSRRAMTSHRV
ncbi:hypothetical protein A5906_05285 [Bradyrhizobium sacchari]|nr:hypothetical protein A5906_05285 [Bradyrhizobium sacchari]